MAVVHAPDLTLYPQADGTATADAGAIRATLAADLSAGNLLSVESQGYVLRYGTGDVTYVDTAGRHQVLSAIASAPLAVKGSIATYAPLAAPYRVEYEVHGDRMKRNVVLLASLPAPDKAVFPDMESVYLAVHGPLTVPAGLSVRAEGQAFADNLWTASTVDLVDSTGKAVMHLDRVWAESKTGHVCAGRYRLVTDPLTGALQVYELLPWWWLRTLTTADYPVAVDPTVMVASRGSSISKRNLVKVSATRHVAILPVAGGMALYVSDDKGLSWQLCTTPANGIVSANVDAQVAAHADVDGNIHALFAVPSAMTYAFITLSGLAATVTTTQVEPGAGTDYTWRPELVVHSGAAGATKNLVLAYHRQNTLTSGNQSLYCRTATATTAGVLALGALTTIDSNVEGGERFVFALSKRLDGQVKLLYQRYDNAGPGFVRIVTIPMPMTASPTQTTVSNVGNHMNNVSGIDGMAQCMWMGTGGTYFNVWDESAGPKYSLSHANYRTGTQAAVAGDNSLNRLTFVGADATSPYYPRWFEVAIATGVITDKGLVNSVAGVSNSTYQLTGPRDWDLNVLPFMYSDGTNVQADKVSYNQPPTKPTGLTRTNYDGADAATLAWLFNDPDGGAQASRQVQIVRVTDGAIWDSGKVASSVQSFTLPAATLVNNKQYQWRVMTWDPSDAASPWSDYATFWCSGKPTAAITYPGADGAVHNGGPLTAQGTVSDPESEGSSAFQFVLTDNADALLWDGGKTASTTPPIQTVGYTSWTNGAGYKLKLTAWDAKGVQSVQVVRTFTVSFTPPAVPVPTVIPNPDQYPPYMEIQVLNPDNLLTANQADVEVDLTGFDSYAPGNNAAKTFVRDTAVFHHGTASARLSTTAAGNLQIYVNATALTPVKAGQVYSGAIMARRTAAGPLLARIEWKDATGAAMSQVDGPTVQAAALTWTQASVVLATAPVGAAFARLLLNADTCAANDNLWWDTAQLNPGPLPGWAPPGTKVTANRIERRIAGTFGAWTSLGTCPANGFLRDYSAASKAMFEYRAVAIGDNQTDSPSHQGDGGFESGLLGWTLGNTTQPAIETTNVYSGKQSLKITRSDTTGWCQVERKFSCKAGDAITWSGAYRLQNVKQFHAKATFMDAAGVAIGGAVQNPGGTDAAGATAWVPFSQGALTAPAGTASVTFSVMGGWSFDGVNPGISWGDGLSFTINGINQLAPGVAGGIDRDCWWFVPISDPSLAVPFAFNREASGQPQRDRTEVKTRGPVPIKFDGGTDIDTIQIQAMWVDPEWASPHDGVRLSREEWRQRFLALDFDTEGYLLEPGGAVWRGFIEVNSYTWQRDMIVNPLLIPIAFTESGEV